MLQLKSFTQMIDDYYETVFFKSSITSDVKDDIIKVILKRQVKTGTNSGSFSLSNQDYHLGKWLFSRERIVTKLAEE